MAGIPRQFLDDEMSRFEAEIAAVEPVGITPLPAPPAALKAVIGSKTFNKVQEQLDVGEAGKNRSSPQSRRLLPPPPLPTLYGTNDDSFQKPFPGGSFNQGRNFAPTVRPPFIPPQISRGPTGPEPMFPGATRPPFIEAPPPEALGILKMQPAVIAKPPTVFSSTPKINKEALAINASVKNSAQSTNGPKKKKAKKDHSKEGATVSVPVKLPEKVQPVVKPPIKPIDEKKKDKKSKKNLRYAGGKVWEDSSLSEWDSDDFRLFAGDLGNDVTDELLTRYFSHYPSFVKAKVIRDKRTNKSKGYGFISFRDSADYIRSMKEVNGRYVGSRPIKLRKSMWRDRSLDVVQKKVHEKKLMGLK